MSDSFKTRAAFLRNARRLLKDGGVLAISDLLLPDRPLSWKAYVIHRIICLAAGVPWRNMVNEAHYRASSIEAGFDVMVIEDCTADVFVGLADHINRLGADAMLRIATNSALRSKYVGFAKVLRWYARGNMRFVLVKAKPANAR